VAPELTAVNGGEIICGALAIPRLKAGGYTRPNQPGLGEAPFHGANGKRSRASCASFFKNSELYCHSSCRFVQLRGRSLAVVSDLPFNSCMFRSEEPTSQLTFPLCSFFCEEIVRTFDPRLSLQHVQTNFENCRSLIRLFRISCFEFRICPSRRSAAPGTVGPLAPESWTRLAGATVRRAHPVHLFFGFTRRCVPFLST
jgi:hypothetical protein